MIKITALVIALATPAAAWAAAATLYYEPENTKFSPERMAEIAALM
jgi:hypothetical protein